MTSIQTVETVVVLLVNLNTGTNGMISKRLSFQIVEMDILLSKKNVRLLILIRHQLNFATRHARSFQFLEKKSNAIELMDLNFKLVLNQQDQHFVEMEYHNLGKTVMITTIMIETAVITYVNLT